nr:shootin-1-like isoform X6 [Nerophis lumbriciformis]
MDSEDFDRKIIIDELTNKALQEYEGLQRKHESATIKCKILEGERDQAVKQLHEFQQVSKMVIEEVAVIQEKLEIERTCRESAEALASKLNRQNHSLKRKSMVLLSQVSTQTITEINLEDEEVEEEEDEYLGATSQDCQSAECQTKISELQSALQKKLTTKNEMCDDITTLRKQLEETKQELMKEKHENNALVAETVQQKKLLGKYNRVSAFALEEYKTIQDTLTLQQDLRDKAENFARAMVVEQKMLKRKSQILMESSPNDCALQEALKQLSGLTKDLEAQKLEHQSQIKLMEDQLSSCQTRKELMALRCKLELVEEEKRECCDEYCKAQAQVKDLSFTEVDVRQQAVQKMMDRIKNGVQLRPVRQRPHSKKQMNKMPSNSAFQELKAIMVNSNRSCQVKMSSSSSNCDDELQKILLRRCDLLRSPNAP